MSLSPTPVRWQPNKPLSVDQITNMGQITWVKFGLLNSLLRFNNHIPQQLISTIIGKGNFLEIYNIDSGDISFTGRGVIASLSTGTKMWSEKRRVILDFIQKSHPKKPTTEPASS